MFGIRSCPFGRDEDAADFMIQIMDEEATREGKPLSPEEKALLRDEIGPNDVPDEFHFQMQRLVVSVLKKERETGQAEHPRSFGCAIEWAGDQEYPYVVRLAEDAVIGARGAVKGWAAAKDTLMCIGCGFVIVLTMFVIVLVLSSLGLMK